MYFLNIISFLKLKSFMNVQLFEEFFVTTKGCAGLQFAFLQVITQFYTVIIICF